MTCGDEMMNREEDHLSRRRVGRKKRLEDRRVHNIYVMSLPQIHDLERYVLHLYVSLVGVLFESCETDKWDIRACQR